MGGFMLMRKKRQGVDLTKKIKNLNLYYGGLDSKVTIKTIGMKWEMDGQLNLKGIRNEPAISTGSV